MPILRRYGVADAIEFPLVKRAVMDLAVTGDYTPVMSDVSIHIDAASASYATNLVVATGSYGWSLWMTAANYTGKKITVALVDAATKAVEDQFILIETYGSPLAQHPFDFSVPTVTLSQPALDQAAVQIVNTVWATGSRTLSSLQTDVISAAAISAAGGAKIADIVLRRTAANARASSDGDAANFRTLLGATSKLVNKVAVNGANLEIMQENDTTVYGTQAITTDSAAAPITALDTT